jgi:PadR family transcriptional regulator PadR
LLEVIFELARLEDQKLVTSAWETPQAEGERPRRYYQLTGEGIRVARLELAQVRAGRLRATARLGHTAPGSL